MEQRIDLVATSKDAYRAVLGLSQYAVERVDPTLLEMIKLRASMVNGCAFCVDMHTTEWLAQGEDVRRIVAVSAWRESPFFSDRERAVLALTDAVTRLDEHGVPDELYDEVRAHFSEAEYVDLVVGISQINVWNRLAISVRNVAPPLAEPVAAHA